MTAIGVARNCPKAHDAAKFLAESVFDEPQGGR
jgi:hypothetical protein